jgi:hypothetical protein
MSATYDQNHEDNDGTSGSAARSSAEPESSSAAGSQQNDTAVTAPTQVGATSTGNTSSAASTQQRAAGNDRSSAIDVDVLELELTNSLSHAPAMSTRITEGARAIFNVDNILARIQNVLTTGTHQQDISLDAPRNMLHRLTRKPRVHPHVRLTPIVMST